MVPAVVGGGEAVPGAAQGDLGQHPAYRVVDAGVHFAAPFPPWPAMNLTVSEHQFAETDPRADSLSISKLQNELPALHS